MTNGLTGIPGTYPEAEAFCKRLDYHDGPCNGYERTQCALKNKLEREGKLMSTTSGKAQEVAFIRPWYSQGWAWVSGRL